MPESGDPRVGSLAAGPAASLADPSAPLLFEIAFEVARQIGGIYTVLRSKAAVTTEIWGDRYCLIGPYDPATATTEFEELSPGPLLGPTMETLRSRGINVHYGRWLVTGNPRVLLVDFYAAFDRLDEFRSRFWDECGINYPDNDAETNDAVAFAYLVTEFFECFCENHPNRRVIAHFHEWLSAAALPLIRRRKLPVATVFTTHATLLGRYICATTRDFYERLPWIDPDAEAGERQIYHRYCVERAATASADVFTTVSDITATEAEHLLRRKPDKILPNGLRLEKFAALHEFQNLHRESKERIHHFVQGHFFGHHSFDLDKTIYIFTSGRYEYHNKGIDMFIEGLARLNNHLMHAGSEVTVVTFIVTRAATHHLNIDVLNNHSMLRELKDCCAQISRKMQQRLFNISARGEIPRGEDLLSPEELVVLKRLVHSRHKHELPPIVTHHMADDANDPILNHLRHRQLFNNRHDRVKLVYHPEFINRTNPLFAMDYPDFVRGCHLGIFPSYYEPWGYTPAECAVLGVPAICTDLSGFGAFMESNVPDHDDNGIWVVRRRGVDASDSIDQLTNILVWFTGLDRRQRIHLRNRVERLSQCLDWNLLNTSYEEARDLALQRAYA